MSTISLALNEHLGIYSLHELIVSRLLPCPCIPLISNGKGSALVAALTKSGKRFGGYNPLGWMSSDDYGNANNAFLWFEQNGKGVKFPVLSGGNAAIFDFATRWPTFGSADLSLGPPQAAVRYGECEQRLGICEKKKAALEELKDL